MQSSNKVFSRRVFILLIIKLGLLFTLIIRFFYLQIRENFHFNSLSDKNRTNLVPIIPKRGIIFDNLNIRLADNLFLWELLFIKSQIPKNVNLFINTLTSIIEINADEKARILYDYKNKPAHFPILVKQNLSQSEIAAIETFSYNLPGVFIRPFYRRNYPYSDALAHLIGYTSITNDLSKSNNVPHWQIGRYAMEESLDAFLKGSVGYSKYEINAHGHIIRKLEQKTSIPGNNIALTIDSALQNKIYELLSEYNSASAVVSEIKTGKILAMSSYPSFDPNLFTEGIPAKVWSELLENEKAPLSNKPMMGLYPPGSTIKPMLALEALAKGVITADTTFECKGYHEVGRDRFHCWLRKGHGKVNLEKSISQSCDIYYYNLANLLDSKYIDEASKNFGFGKKHLNILPNEAKGKTIINEESTKKSVFGDKIIAMIGQGNWLVTPLQLNKMISLIANYGMDYKYSLLKNIEYEDKVVYPKQDTAQKVLHYPKEHFELIKKALYNTVNEKGGSGILANTYDPSWILSGKTGTSQVRRISLKERQEGIIPNHLVPWNRRDHGLFVGYVSSKNEDLYAISVVIEHGGSAAITAAPLAREIAKMLKERYPFYEEENERINKIIFSRK